ncbi:hypothetical protein AB6A40_006366 [Gnathostoma spinigerum]|uniref:Uncharacterized protein n=1 Tax=Gnathostoma spinigerum TaxID=75299 RepID=A0ABD6ESZ5_9BILA
MGLGRNRNKYDILVTNVKLGNPKHSIHQHRCVPPNNFTDFPQAVPASRSRHFYTENCSFYSEGSRGKILVPEA